MLTEYGHTVRLARNGELALLGVRAARPDLILLDINLPDMDGYEICEQLKADARTRDIPIIFISVRDQLQDKVKALSVGGVDYITKPFQSEEVLARVATHLKLYRLQRQLTAEKARVERARTMLWTVLNNLDALIYVADLETYEVLFANARIKDVFGEIEGRVCWRALQEGLDGPCDFCTNPELLDERGRPTGIVRWQFQNTRNGRWYTVADSAIAWMDGRMVRLSMAADITAYKRAEARLLAQQRLTATLDERERIGRELHDDLGQVMSYVSLQTQAALERLGREDLETVRAILHQLVQVSREAHDDVRQYILGVRTRGPIPSQDLFTALEDYLGILRRRYGLDVQVSWPDDLLESPLAPSVEGQLLRIIQEALTNVRKHAGVDVAQLLFTAHDDGVQVVVSDAGSGFHPLPDGGVRKGDRTDTSSTSFGLQIMRERAESVGGSLEVRSAPGRGTQVIVGLPASLSAVDDVPLAGGLRVLLVDDHPLYLEGLHGLLAARGVQVVGVAHDGVEAQAQARALQPDLILMDVQMPRCDGVEATRRIKAELEQVQVVMLTMAADEETLFEALKAGASGYLLKNLAGAQFFALLRQVMAGETVISPALASRVLDEFAGPGEGAPVDEPVLTARQREVLELVAQGLTNKEVAAALHITERTVKYHVSQILERLQLKSRHQLARYVDGA
jgi:DNA-binding NarL/FixJ family response regulator/two-component sensor histidine kinase